MTNFWEALFFVNFFCYLAVQSFSMFITRRTLRQHQVMNTRWRAVVAEQRETIDELRRALGEQPLPPEPPIRPRSILWPWRE